MLDLYAEEIAVTGTPVADLCIDCIVPEECDIPPGGNCEFCDTGACDCFSTFCQACIA
jgi:hypothetical protein